MEFNETNSRVGYIYVRTHTAYDIYNACKLGKTANICERDAVYATGEIIRGQLIVYKVYIEDMSDIEVLLQYEFRELNIKYNGGSEFFSNEIIVLIEPYFNKVGIAYKKLSKQQINDLLKCYKMRDHIVVTIADVQIMTNKVNRRNYASNQQYIPRDYQRCIINAAYEYFKCNKKGILVIPCGVGKTLISLWITQKINSGTILIGVPNKLLLEQWKQIINAMFPNIPCIIVRGGVECEDIKKFIISNSLNCIVITTYSSSYKVFDASTQFDFTFDMKILDECHHLTTYNMQLTQNSKKYVHMLNIQSTHQLSLTATIKQIEHTNNTNDNIIVSNDNIEYFGNIIERKSLMWAINENIICDYAIQTIITDEEQFETQLLSHNIFEENDKRLFFSAYVALKSIYDGHSHHLLVYANNVANSSKIIKYIKLLLTNEYFSIDELYYSEYHSEMNHVVKNNVIDEFKKLKFGIIACVYCLGEGWDFPLLDGVVFAENMSSNIRIVQSALRSSRKNNIDVNKISKIILPVLNKSDWLENNENLDFKKVKEVIYQMGLEDETINQKIKVFKTNIEKHTDVMGRNENNDILYNCDIESTRRLKLKTINRSNINISYNKAKQLIVEKNIKSKAEYFKLCEEDYRLPIEPNVIFKKHFVNWIEYLSIEQIYYTFEMCKTKVSEYLNVYLELKKHHLNLSQVCIELCKIDVLFPPADLWVEYYNVNNLRDIINMTTNKKKMGIKI
jgi:superfamily II DNA or RNA helicase